MGSEHDLNRAIALGSSWLATCLENHPSCAKRARHSHIFCSDNNHFITDLDGSGLVPSRLLKFSIEPPCDHGQDLVKLVLSSSLDAHTQYAALSHCWGSLEKQPLRTLTGNILSLVEDGVRFQELPRTFRDAIEVARGMGYNHLWIDSLCIVQDSPEDWKREARRMAIIYDNAVFTMAVMDAVDSSQGLFPADGHVGKLESRAWACQERMVAPRTLNFTKQSVTWECRQGHATPELRNFTDERDNVSTTHNDMEWTPPTNSKAIFEFFRDWRLPPKNEEDLDKYNTRYAVMVSNVSPEETKASDGELLPGIEHDRSGTDGLLIDGGSGDNQSQQTSEPLSQLIMEPGDHSKQEPSSMEVFKRDLASVDPYVKKIDQGKADTASPNVEEVPPFIWSASSDTDHPVKLWNVWPPLGESGTWTDQESQTVYIFFGNDVKAHAAHLISQADYPIQDQRWVMQFDEPLDEEIDPFGHFLVFVADLMRPKKAYYPFLRVWWNFLTLYTPRTLSYDSDAFLAINGITSVAQRWTHLRNTFGLWLNFLEKELCWYIEPKVPASRPKSPQWIAPSWSWASTRQGQVSNSLYRLWPMQPTLLIKPEIHIPSGTAFDMPLPFTAWQKSRYHGLELKGSLRKGCVRRMCTDSITDEIKIEVEQYSRRSDHEMYTFYPDVVEEFPADEEVDIWVLPIWHFDGNEPGYNLGHHLDVMVVLRVIWDDYWITHYNTETLPEDIAADERTMRRVGLLEATYELHEERDSDAINEDWMWKFVRIL